MQSEISHRFHELAMLPETQQGLAEGALIVAAEVRPEIDVASGLEALSEITERARPLVEAARTPSAAVDALNHALFELERFRGNQDQYDDPRNSFLDEVLSRRRGLPITLSILYVEIARQLGLEAYGIGFPGHFLAKVVGVSDVAERLLEQQALGGQGQVDASRTHLAGDSVVVAVGVEAEQGEPESVLTAR